MPGQNTQDPNNPNSPEQVFYFINNAQGTPTIIQNNNQQPVAKINLNEWGVPGFVLGQQEEINFTGKKLDRSTGLYYFNQRYYDPEIGRFLSEDPAGQTSNPYLFCGNNPMMYIDPNGEFFIIDDIIVAAIWAAAQAAAASAAINAAVQYVTTGTGNWNSVGQAALSGAISGGLASAIGGVGSALKDFGGEGLLQKTIAHGVSGGLQSMANGGSFGSGFVGGAAGNLAGSMGGNDVFTRTAYAGAAAGVTSWATGGDFATGFQSGAYNEMYNWGMHEGKNLLGGAKMDMGDQQFWNMEDAKIKRLFAIDSEGLHDSISPLDLLFGIGGLETAVERNIGMKLEHHAAHHAFNFLGKNLGKQTHIQGMLYLKGVKGSHLIARIPTFL